MATEGSLDWEASVPDIYRRCIETKEESVGILIAEAWSCSLMT